MGLLKDIKKVVIILPLSLFIMPFFIIVVVLHLFGKLITKVTRLSFLGNFLTLTLTYPLRFVLGKLMGWWFKVSEIDPDFMGGIMGDKSEPED